jgi:sugar (pentulose or hexulose) kinase
VPDGCFIGVDVGTSGCRAGAVDHDGTQLAETRTPLDGSHRPVPGHSEQRPEDWWEALVGAVGDLTRRLDRRPVAIGIDATSSTLLLSDVVGRPLTPGLMYDDRRATAAADRIAGLAPPDSPARGPGSALSKLLHLIREGVYADAVHALHQADWLSGRLTGRYGVSDENNALKLGYDPVARSWPTWLNQLPGVEGRLPRVVPPGSLLGPIDADVAGALGLPEDVTVVAGTTDSNAATLAASSDIAERLGTAVTSLGSTLVLKVWSDRPVFDARFGVYSHRIDGLWLVGGASNSGGAVLRRFFSDAELAHLSRRIDPALSSALDYYPLPTVGERFPVADATLAPRLTPRPEEPERFLHGLLEGIANIEAQGYRLLASLGAPFPRQVLSAGGGAANPTWQAIRARLLGVPVSHARHAEAVYGIAMLVRRAMQTHCSGD